MRDKRQPGLSLLDYLWTNYGIYSISDKLEESPEEYVPTQALLINLLLEVGNKAIGSVSLKEDYLIFTSTSGLEISRVDIHELSSSSISISDFGSKFVGQEDIDAGCPFPLFTKVYYIKLSNGRQFWTRQETLKGYSTSTIKTEIIDDYIHSTLLLDEDQGNVTLTTTNGLKANVNLFEEVNTLPVIGNKDKIYLLAVSENTYQAYIYINNVAVSLGNVGGDLSNRIDQIEQTLTWNEF